MIELRNICKHYGKKTIYNNLNIKIKDNKITVITGNSGCGKSTLLNIIGLIDECESGDVIIDNIKTKKIGSLFNSKIIRSKISYLFQNYALIDDYTIRDNLLIALKYTNYSKQRKEKIMNDIVKVVNLDISLDQYIYECSGGEQQRIALARALIKPSKIILCDEPTGNLDSDNAMLIMKLLKLVKDKYHKCIVVVTHDLRMLEIADVHYQL
ncbi:MAG: ABC transporter ATP-binding protein [Bacilli bacterium]|jgi:putative ABC transport system ATP-binding protein|nr:ABC transporter ATP-binding protein [Bacilli bacterium]